MAEFGFYFVCYKFKNKLDLIFILSLMKQRLASLAFISKDFVKIKKTIKNIKNNKLTCYFYPCSYHHPCCFALFLDSLSETTGFFNKRSILPCLFAKGIKSYIFYDSNIFFCFRALLWFWLNFSLVRFDFYLILSR